MQGKLDIWKPTATSKRRRYISFLWAKLSADVPRKHLSFLLQTSDHREYKALHWEMHNMHCISAIRVYFPVNRSWGDFLKVKMPSTSDYFWSWDFSGLQWHKGLYREQALFLVGSENWEGPFKSTLTLEMIMLICLWEKKRWMSGLENIHLWIVICENLWESRYNFSLISLSSRMRNGQRRM